MDEDVARRTVRSIVKAGKAFRALAHRRLGELGLHPGQDVVLLALFDDPGGQTVTGLADRLGVEPPTMTRSLDRLEEGGWVRRTRSSADRRVVEIRATDKARNSEDQLRALWLELAQTATTGLSETERQTLVSTLERVRSNLEQA